VFSGLALTSISAAVLHAALFQRKARSGWLEELDEIRGDALVSPDGTVDEVVDGGDIWTDLREGGEYTDPHEISSLYANDDTPDLPPPRPKAPAKPARTPRPGRSKARDEVEAAAPDPTPADPPPAAPLAELPPPPAAPAPDLAPAAPEPVGTDVGGPYESEPMWVQPAPHPIRPSEMWHPAELAPPTLGDEHPAPPAEERLRSDELVEEASTGGFAHVRPIEHDPAAAAAAAGWGPSPETWGASAPATPAPAPSSNPFDHEPAIDHVRASELETELAAAADLTVMDDAYVLPIDPTLPSEGGLVTGPVGRRVRRDRPSGRPDALPIAPGAEERSPLPERPLPPAALPVRDVVSAAPTPVAEPVVEPVIEPVAVVEPVAEPVTLPAVEAAVVEVDAVEPAPVAPPAAAASPAPTAVAVVPAPDGILEVPGTIVRLGGARRAAAISDPDGLAVELAEGWLWVSPGDGTPTQVRIDLPHGRVEVDASATVLAVAEPDGSAFVLVADGSVVLHRQGDGATLTSGAIVMLDPSGTAQLDQATDAEIEADPIVAENLALDAEL
jgi:hypothetical protein